MNDIEHQNGYVSFGALLGCLYLFVEWRRFHVHMKQEWRDGSEAALAWLSISWAGLLTLLGIAIWLAVAVASGP